MNLSDREAGKKQASNFGAVPGRRGEASGHRQTGNAATFWQNQEAARLSHWASCRPDFHILAFREVITTIQHGCV